MICGYVAFRFEPKYAVPVIIAVIHDILITGGVYSLTGREVTSGTVAAFLTILGYSLYDTVIVFDRIRENVPRLPRATFSQIVNRSMSEVLTRSLITGAVERLPGDGAVHLRRRDVEGLRLRDDDRAAVGYVLVDLHRVAGAHRTGRSANRPTAAAASASRSRWAACRRSRRKTWSREPRVVPRSRSRPRRRCPPPLPRAARRSPASFRNRPDPSHRRPRPSRPSRRRRSARHGTAGPTAVTVLPSGDGAADGGGDGAEQAERERPELSEASAAALRRVREQQSGGRRQKRRKKHGRNR